MRLGTAYRRALGILAGCPQGANELALKMHRVSQALLDRLVADGHVTMRTVIYRQGLAVDRFEITVAGRRALVAALNRRG